MAAFGIHFGSTNASLAVCKEGKADVVANEAGDRTTPAIVAFTDHDVSVGLAAKQGLVRNAGNTVVNVKQLIGRHGDEPEAEEIINKSAVKIVCKDNVPHYEVDHKEMTKVVSPVEIASHVYKTMLQIAEHQVGSSESHDAVITVPIAFSDQRRQAFRDAAERAGFNVLRIINEPSAALLAYDIGQTSHSEHCKVLVYRLGGSSLDVTVLSVASGMYQVLSSLSTPEVAGHNFTEVLVKHFAAEFKRQWKCDCLENKRATAKLRSCSENAKHILSNLPSAQCSVDSLYEGIDFQCNISRARFEGLCGGLLQGCIGPVDMVLKQAGLQPADISKVVICGGSAQIPIIRSKISSYFPNSELLTTLSPEEVIATGAAKQASILSSGADEETCQFERETQVPCLSTDILMETIENGESKFATMFGKYTPIPSRLQKAFSLGEDQTAFLVHILMRATDGSHTSLAKIVMKELPGSSTINVVFHIRGDGSLHVTCREPTSEKAQDILIDSS